MMMRQQKIDKRKICFVAILAFSLFTAFSVVPSVQASSFYVPDDHSTIQTAVNAASFGDTIIVRDGTYVENIGVDKSLTIRSENGQESTILRAEDPGYEVINVTYDYVDIHGFTVEGATDSAGIYLYNADYCTIMNNSCRNNYNGIYIEHSNENSIANNTCYSNFLASIYIRSSASNKLTGNVMREGGIWIDSDSRDNYTHEIDESNIANGKSVCYWKDARGGRVPDDAGQIILVNCTNVLIEDQNVNNASIGLDVAFSSEITMKNNTYSYNKHGIIFSYSTKGSISNNTCSSNVYGLYLLGSTNNSITTSNYSANKNIGIYLRYSHNNRIFDNAASNSVKHHGIFLESSKKNKIAGNTVNSNFKDGIGLFSASENVIANNMAKENGLSGIYLADSNKNNVSSNICINNYDGINLQRSNKNTICNNNCTNNSREYKSGFDLIMMGYGIYIMHSHNNTLSNNNCTNNGGAGIHLEHSTDSSISNNNCSYNRDGIYLVSSRNNNMSYNLCTNNIRSYGLGSVMGCGIFLRSSVNNSISNNHCTYNLDGIYLYDSRDNRISQNNNSNNTDRKFERRTIFINSSISKNTNNNKDNRFMIRSHGIEFDDSNANYTQDPIFGLLSSGCGIKLEDSNSNSISCNNCSNSINGICLIHSNNNLFYLNNFINNDNKVDFYNSTNAWNSTEPITYTYNETTHINYLGNYWDDYTGTDSDEDGIGDAYYSIGGDRDNYPLMMPWASYFT